MFMQRIGFARHVCLAVAFIGMGMASVRPVSGQEGRAENFVELLRQAEAKSDAKRWQEAIPLWERVVTLNPVRGSYWSELGTACYQAKDYRKCIQAKEKVLELCAEFPWATTYDIACCYARLGEKAKAMQWLQKSFDLGFRSLAHAQQDDDLQSLRDDPRFRELVAFVDGTKRNRVEGWRYDLALLEREVRRKHYRSPERISQPEFAASVKRLSADVPKLTDSQILVRILRLMTSLGDGHTMVFPPDMFGGKTGLPVEFYLFAEGLYIIQAEPAYRDLLGAQVLKFGTHEAAEVMEALSQIAPSDNAMTPKWTVPKFLMRFPVLLNGLGFQPESDRVTLTLRDQKGETRAVTLEAKVGMPDATWISAHQTYPGADPLTLKDRRSPYWFEFLPESKTVFCQYNSVRNDSSESLEAFCKRLFAFIQENPVERLVLDMRWNNGGNNFLNKPLVNGLIACDKINRRGRLFVIVGRNTFSAAMCGAAQIERFTNALFVGEPTGSRPNFVGEDVHITLPYSKLDISTSDLFWQNSHAMDYRTWIAPTLYAPPTFALYQAKRDPAMEAIAAYPAEH